MSTGTHKFPLTHEILEAMACYGVLPLMRELDRLPQFYELRVEFWMAASQPTSVLRTSRAVLRFQLYQVTRICLTYRLFTVCSILAVIVMPTSTLSQAPAVLTRAEEAASLHPAWKSTCDAIASSKLIEAHKMVAQVLSAGMSVTGHVEALFNVLESHAGPQEAQDKRASLLMKEKSRLLLNAAKHPGAHGESQLARVPA